MDVILKQMPEDVRMIVLEEQKDEKQRRGVNQYSLALTIYKIIKEWNNKCKQVK